MDYVLIPTNEILVERMREAGVFNQNQTRENGKTTIWDFLSAVNGLELTGKQLSAYWKTCRGDWLETLIRFYQKGGLQSWIFDKERTELEQVLCAIDVGKAVYTQALDCLLEIFTNVPPRGD